MSETGLPDRLGSYVRKSGIALALSDTSTDAPLLVVNKAFCDLTGYSEDEVVGQNCRFLQGPETTEEMREPLHDFVHGQGGDSGRFPILNYRKDGSTFMNYVFMTRLRDEADTVRFILASQFDMSTAVRRSKIGSNDERLGRTLSDMDQIAREFGLAMVESAQLLSDSVATMARFSLEQRKWQ